MSDIIRHVFYSRTCRCYNLSMVSMWCYCQWMMKSRVSQAQTQQHPTSVTVTVAMSFATLCCQTVAVVSTVGSNSDYCCETPPDNCSPFIGVSSTCNRSVCFHTPYNTACLNEMRQEAGLLQRSRFLLLRNALTL